MQSKKFAIVIHGGAGVIKKSFMTEQEEKSHRDALKLSLETGYDILNKGGRSLDAVIAAVKVLEDSPYFNAGRGSIFTRDGQIEMEATIMDGKDLKAGAVTGIKSIKNPIEAAYEVMTKTPHVMLMGEGAEKFAREQGLKFEDASYFWTEARWKAHKKGLETNRIGPEMIKGNDNEINKSKHDNQPTGTVGAVALDIHGNIAVATSTGGKTNKMFGRIGDSAIIGSGTYANNKTCAISCTGTAEYYMRLAGAHDISAIIEYAGMSLEEAANLFVYKKLKDIGGDGGIIGIDTKGNIVMPFISEGMYRGYMRAGEDPKIFIYDEDRGKEFVQLGKLQCLSEIQKLFIFIQLNHINDSSN